MLVGTWIWQISIPYAKEASTWSKTKKYWCSWYYVYIHWKLNY